LINHCVRATKTTADSTQGTEESGEEHAKAETSLRDKFSVISTRCGFNIDEESCEELMEIRSREASSLLKSIAREKIIEAMTSGKLRSLDWRDNSKELMHAINIAATKKVKSVVRKIKGCIPNVRIVCASGEKKELNKKQRSILLKKIMQYSNKRFSDSTARLWRQLVVEYSPVVSSGVSSAAGSSGASVAAGPSGVSSAAGSSGASVAAGPSGVSSAAGSNRVSVIVSTGVASTTAGSSGVSAAPTSLRDEFTQASSSSVTDKGKSKGKKRKIDDAPDVASSEDRPAGIVPFGYGPILVREEFDNEIRDMVLEHLGYVDSVFGDIRRDLEEVGSYTDDNMSMQSREAIANIMPEFMDRVRAVLSNASVYDSNMIERGIDEDEVSSVEAHMYGFITICHGEILDRNLATRTVNNK
ncbi:hypothetical protein, partial [Candidatus Ichthyocystis hellenicum]|uniref:hypothetical protein n=1 Tax=Candidatus Ichthyocystis hellenicum TaxID=1561003 RepID=UPI000A9CB6C3